MSDQVEDCKVCACPVRRQIDMMLFEGWHEPKICEMLPEAPRDPVIIAAHWRAGHAELDKDALTVCAIGTMRDARDAFNVAYTKFGKGSTKFGPAIAKALDVRLKGLDFLARLHGHMRPVESGQQGVITNNVINMAIEADPELLMRIAETVVEGPKPKVQIRLRKKDQDAIETTATKPDNAAA